MTEKNPCVIFGLGYGACTVLVNGEAELSCQYPLQNVEEKEVLTIEGLSKNGDLHPIQKAFLQHNAFHDAIGVRMFTLPMTPARIKEALKKV